MENYSQQEKVQICIDIANNLKNFKGAGNEPVNLFNESFGVKNEEISLRI